MQPPKKTMTPYHQLRKYIPLAFIAFFLLVMGFFSGALLPFILAMFIAYIFAPAVSWLAGPKIGFPYLRLPRWAGVLAVYFTFFSIIGFFGAFALPKLAYEVASMPKAAGELAKTMQSKAISDWIPFLNQQMKEYFPEAVIPESGAGTADAPINAPPLDRPVIRFVPGYNGVAEIDLSNLAFEAETNENGIVRLKAVPAQSDENGQLNPGEAILVKLQAVLQEAPEHAGEWAGKFFSLMQRVFAGIAAALIVIMLMFMVAAFLLIDLNQIHAFLRSLVPMRFQDDYDNLVGLLDAGLAGVIRGQLIICLVNGIFSGIGFAIFEVKFAVILAVFAGVMSLIPIFGSILSSIPAVAIAFSQAPTSPDDYSGIVRSALVLGWILLIHFVEANFLNPKIIGTNAKIHPALVILVLVIGEHYFGLMGALLAVPFFSILQTIFLYARARAGVEELSDT